MIEMAKRYKDLNDENKSIFERILSLNEQEKDDKFELLAHNLLYVTAQVQTIDSTFANDIILFVRNQIECIILTLSQNPKDLIEFSFYLRK